jgi:hypothetical protein
MVEQSIATEVSKPSVVRFIILMNPFFIPCRAASECAQRVRKQYAVALCDGEGCNGM